MKTKIFVVFVSLLILLPSVGLAQGGWITLPAQAFHAKWSNFQWNNLVSSGGESYLYPLGTGEPMFVAPVVFPQEADGLSVRQINATVGDDDSSNYIYVVLFRMNRYSGIIRTVFGTDTGLVSSTPGKTVITDTQGGYRLIDSKKYAWFVYVLFSGVPTPEDNLRFYAVRIQYQ